MSDGSEDSSADYGRFRPGVGIIPARERGWIIAFFEPRPTGNDVRRRNGISMALIILAAGALWLYYSQMSAGPVPVAAPPQTQAGQR